MNHFIVAGGGRDLNPSHLAQLPFPIILDPVVVGNHGFKSASEWFWTIWGFGMFEHFSTQLPFFSVSSCNRNSLPYESSNRYNGSLSNEIGKM